MMVLRFNLCRPMRSDRTRQSNPHLRFYLTSAAVGALSCAVILLLLTLMDQRLDRPEVLRFDLLMQDKIHGLTNPHLTRVMLALTWLGSIKIFATALAIAIVYLVRRDGRHAAALLGGAISGAFVLNEMLKEHFHRARPLVSWSIGDEHTFSFPSGHSLFAVVFYGTLAYVALHRRTSTRRRFGILLPAKLMPLGIGLSRIYLGMHYPTDVLAGFLTGALWLAAVVAIDRAWHVLART